MADSQENELKVCLDLGLSDPELSNLGRIVAYWGHIEHEVFLQAVLTWRDGETLPKRLNNMQFSDTLEYWETRVVETATGDRKDKLRDILSRIRHYHIYRSSLIHGMWKWEPTDPSVIVATIIAKEKYTTFRYTESDLAKMATELASIFFDLRHPTGITDRVKDLENSGGYISRNFFIQVTRRMNSKMKYIKDCEVERGLSACRARGTTGLRYTNQPG